MNADNRTIKAPKIKQRAPLFASPWMALYLVLRDELLQPRPGNG